MQFSSIYPVILVPSVYFIDSSTGVDLEITGGIVTKESLMASIRKAFAKIGEAAETVQADPVAAVESPVLVSETTVESSASEPKKENEESKIETVSTTSGEQPKQLEDRVEKAKLLMEQRRLERENQEKEKEKDQERERREVGKALLERKGKRSRKRKERGR